MRVVRLSDLVFSFFLLIVIFVFILFVVPLADAVYVVEVIEWGVQDDMILFLFD